LVAGVVLINLILLWPEANPGQYLNDSSIHASMTRWAALRMREGHLPFDGWYPYLSLGASRFHHYQALPAILTGLLSLPLGKGVFPWTGYLLLATWPVAVYCGARLFGMDRWAAAIAALVSPLVVSIPSMGYEFNSYLWRGSGVWTQLWGMWLLPFAWALSWRAVSRRGSMAIAALIIGLTVCLHLLTGYLALLSLGVWVVIGPREFWSRLGRAVLLGLGAIAIAAWMLVPVVTEAKWVTQDVYSRGTLYYDSFGAAKVLAWLFTGGLFDKGRLPMLTALVFVGMAVAIRRFRQREEMRAILGVAALSLLLFFGRPTLGPLLKLLPGGEDLFLRRFVFGVHLAGILLGGLGGWWLAARTRRMITRIVPRSRPSFAIAAVVILGLVFLAPAVAERAAYVARDGQWIAQQRATDATDGAAFASLVAKGKSEGGRIFALSRSDGSKNYRIGQVPAYAALLNSDADGIGFTRPTWSLLSGAESRLDGGSLGQFDLFNIRFVILPDGLRPRVPATQEARAGRHVLWRVDGTSTGYLDLVDTIAPISADRTDLAQQTAPIMNSDLVDHKTLPTVAFAGVPPAMATLNGLREPSGSAGTVQGSSSDPADGVFSGTAEASRDAVVLLKESFDPRWQATVDGAPVPVAMVAPGMPGVGVSAGEHRVVFQYRPYQWYLPLFLLGGVVLALLVWWDRRVARLPGTIPSD
jgi:hypothetical protein